LRRRLEHEFDLSFATAVVVVDIKEAVVRCEFCLNGLRGFAELLEVAPGQLNINSAAGLPCGIGVEGELLDARDRADQGTPSVG